MDEETLRIERAVKRLFASGASHRREGGGSGNAPVPIPIRPTPWTDAAHAALPVLPVHDDQELFFPLRSDAEER